jgi:hypothetical protein
MGQQRRTLGLLTLATAAMAIATRESAAQNASELAQGPSGVRYWRARPHSNISRCPTPHGPLDSSMPKSPKTPSTRPSLPPRWLHRRHTHHRPHERVRDVDTVQPGDVNKPETNSARVLPSCRLAGDCPVEHRVGCPAPSPATGPRSQPMTAYTHLQRGVYMQ